MVTKEGPFSLLLILKLEQVGMWWTTGRETITPTIRYFEEIMARAMHSIDFITRSFPTPFVG